MGCGARKKCDIWANLPACQDKLSSLYPFYPNFFMLINKFFQYFAGKQFEKVYIYLIVKENMYEILIL